MFGDAVGIHRYSSALEQVDVFLQLLNLGTNTLSLVFSD